MRWLLSWLFPLWALLPLARRLGAVTFQEVAGVGWMCTIRPPHTGWQRGAVNAWSAEGRSMGRALRSVIAEAKERPTNGASTQPCAPRLGGPEYDDE